VSGSWLDMLFACQDLILVFSGILWFVVAVSACCLETEKKQSFKLLARFFFCQSIIDWLKMVSISSGFDQWMSFAHSIMLAITFFLLLKVSLADTEKRNYGLADLSINFGIGILIIFSILSIFGRLNFDLPALLLALSALVSLIFLFKFSRFNVVLALEIGLVTVTASIMAVSWPVVLLRLFLSAIIALFVAKDCCQKKVVEDSADLLKNSPYFISVALILGIFSVFWLSRLAEKEIRENILLKAETIATALDPQDFQYLPFEKNSQNLEECQRIRRYLTDYGRLFPDLRGIYTLKNENGKLVFGPENYPIDDPLASPIGTEYLKPDPGIFKVFETARSVVFGPFTDEYGTFVSAFAPVLCPVDGKVLAVIGIDVDARRYNAMIAHSRIWLNIIFCLTSVAIILTVVLFNYRNTKKTEQVSLALNQIESISAIIVGILASIVVFIGSANYENYLAQSELARVATLVSSRISENAGRLKIQLNDLLLMLDSGIMNMEEFSRLTENSCQRKFPYAEFLNPLSPSEIDLMPEAQTVLKHDSKGAQELRFNKGILLKKNPETQKEEAFFYQKISGSGNAKKQFFGYRVRLDQLISLHNKILINSNKNFKIQLYNLENPSWPVAAFPSDEMQPLPAHVLMSRNPGLYFPLFILDKTLVLRFSKLNNSPFFLNIYGPSLILSFACLLVFLIVAVMLRMTRNQNFQLEIQVQKRTHELGKSEKRFRDLVESLSDWVWEIDLEGRYVYCFCSIVRDGQLGIEKMVGQKFYELPTLVNSRQNYDFFRALVANPRAFYDFENTYHLMNGETVIFSNSGLPVYDENGQLLGFRGISRDITEKRSAERELSESRERYMLAVNGNQDGIWDWDIKTNQVFLSSRWKDMIGYQDEELENNFDTFIRFLHPDEKNVVQKYIERYLRGEIEEYNIEFRYRHKKGHYIWVLARGEALRDENGLPYRMAGSHTDISKRKEAEKEIERTLLELEQVIDELHAANDRADELRQAAERANAAKSEFLANMSHEIRTPMNGIIGMVDLMLTTDLNDEQKKYAGVVKVSGEKLMAIINDILDFSKIEAKKLALELVPFSIKKVVEESIDLFSRNASEKGLSLVSDVDSRIPVRVIGDPNRLRQILLNLIDNAVKFTSRGGIKVRVNSVEAVAEKQRIEFSISDTGVGIPEDAKKWLFTAFTQVDGSITRKFGGTGLGLAISYRLVELMNGKLDFNSEEGHGSEFFFSVEFAKVTEEPMEKLFNADTGAGFSDSESARIPRNFHFKALLVEDNQTNQVVAGAMLESLGLDVEIAGNGVEAVNLVLEKKYDIVFMDCQMPELDGFAATSMIRSSGLESLACLPIIAMTAGALAGDREKCLASGMNDYIAKPFRMIELENMISRWLVDGTASATEIKPNDQGDSVSVLNYEQVLERLMNNSRLVKTLLNSFVKETPELFEKIGRAVADGNLDEARTFVHSLKGSAANVGAGKLSNQARKFEVKIIENQTFSPGNEIDQLKKLFDELLAVIKKQQLI